MTVSAYFYGNAFLKMLNKEVDWAADCIQVALCGTAYAPLQDTHDYFNDISGEITGVGYNAGGGTIGTPTIGYTGATNVVKLDGNDVTWGTATITARYAVIYDSTPGSAATNPLIAYVDFGADYTSTASDFKITWHADGIATITPSAP